MFFRDDKTGWDGAAIAIALMLAIAPIGLTFHMAHRGEDPAGPDPRHTRGSDMIQYWVGAAVLEAEASSERLYDQEAFARAFESVETARGGGGYGPTYPPPIYQAFDAVEGLGQMLGTKLMLWFFLLSGGVGTWLLLRSAGYEGQRATEAWLLLWSAPATLLGVATGQPSAIWLAFLGGGLLLWRRERDLFAGVAFSFLCIKPTLAAPVLLTLVLAGQWRAIAGFALGGSAILAASVLRDGVEVWSAYFDMMLRNPDLTQQLWSSLHRHFSLRSLVSVPFAGTAWAAPIGAAGSVAALALAVWFRIRLADRLAADRHAFSAFAILLGASAFATPHLLDYDLVLYFPLMIWVGYRIAETRTQNMRSGIAVLFAFFLVPIAYPVSEQIHFSVGSLAVLLLLGWCVSEIADATDAATSLG